MKSARINFGIGAESEYVLEADDTGVATRCFNPVTGQELGGGGTFYTVSNSEDSSINISVFVTVVASAVNDSPAIIEIFAGMSISIPDNYYYYVPKQNTTAEGSVEEVEIDGNQFYLITGDASFLIQD